MFKSIRWKFITIYFLLVFMAMVIVGVFLINQFEQYHLGVVRDNLTQIANSLRISLKDMDWQKNKEDVQENITYYEKIGMEIYVIGRDTNFTIISSTNLSYLNENATEILEPDLILSSFNGDPGEKDIVPKEEGLTSSKNMVFPLYDEHSRVTGAIYLRQNLEEIYNTLDQSINILIRATILALFITIFVGYFIAKSVTGPINDVTIKAEKMARGDFEQVVEIKSDDEIGQLGNMFNYLMARLKSVLQEMSNEKQKMDTIITYMADGLIATTMEGKVIHANPRALEMLRIQEKDILEKHFDETFKQLNERLTIEYLQNSPAKWSGSQMIEMEYGITLRANYAPYMNEKGDLDGIIVLFQDVTEYEKLENMRKEFVANVSHELKTPLTTIKSYTETLLEGAMENQELGKQFLNVIDNEADRMARLVRDLLQLSNADYQQTKWDKKEVDLNYIVEKAVLNLSVSAKNKEQELNYKGLREGVSVWADENRIEQVLLNVISNAIKYTANGGCIDVSLEETQNHATIKITDNGMGIPKEDLPRIFERFYRVDKARSREMGGTGLGLSIAKQIIDVHEGMIKVDSRESGGTAVLIELPLLQEKMCN
ncbi:multi-sensor signal transduction histidine kinase [Alkaliphilus metalliredigens QYMF]|uniref:histidine kinase n=1 Tax=Alkaliphilus metalliredigens (strain QYMF) TaxID=293826 RepID=A6TXA5_ALKMQ|nr:ATP-binding protein [Alkaliphilus metalliredigens]ABR50823.1 multi-sensor signal transduction histidine kinase [Alkaliphilus metalliredigens QYMF]